MVSVITFKDGVDKSCTGAEKLNAEQAKELAYMMLDEMKADSKLMHAGRRNDDTLNLLICCRIVGSDPDIFLYHEARISEQDFEAYENHRARIAPYVRNDYCPEGKEWYGIDYIAYDTNAKQAIYRYFRKEK